MVAERYLVPLATPCVYYDEDFLRKEDAERYYEDLLKNIKWEKTAKINRWVSLHHELEGVQDYKYRDAPGASQPGFIDTIDTIRQRAEEWYEKETSKEVHFNVCLLNLYEDGHQRIGWHSDREEIGRTTPIASVSLGATRKFLLRGKENGVQDRANLDLKNGSLVIMENECQMSYLHSVPKQNDVEHGRINLTFRCKSDSVLTAGEVEHEIRDNWLKNITDGAKPDSNAWSSPLPVTQNSTPGVFGDNIPTGDLDEEFNTIQFLVKTNLGAEW